MSKPTTDAGRKRDSIIAAMPWYDESDPDYTELDAAILAIEQEARRQALSEVRAAVDDWECCDNRSCHHYIWRHPLNAEVSG